MGDSPKIQVLKDVVVRFAGDSGDGMQLTGTIFSDVSAILGNEISTSPDYPAEIRAPKGSLDGVSGFQVHIGNGKVRTPGDYANVLVAMNPSALKVNAGMIERDALVIVDSDSFTQKDLEKGKFTSDNPFMELGLMDVTVMEVPLTTMVQESLREFGMDLKAMDRSKNMLALGLILWLFDKDITPAENQLKIKFGKKPDVLSANLKVLVDGYNYGHNTHASTTVYHVDGKSFESGKYTEVSGNKATALGLLAASNEAGMELFLGSYPITPATDILHELAKLKHLGVKTVQAEDEIAGICTAIGASFAGDLGITSTSGPGLALKSEALNYAVITELPLVVVDVMRGGPSTGLPTKSEQSDLLQALYGRNGESPVVVMAPVSCTDCFDTAYMAAKIAIEHMTPVVLLTDAYLGNGAAAWRIPNLADMPRIVPPYVQEFFRSEDKWTPYMRNEENLVRYWAVPGTDDYMHRVGGLEKDEKTGAISTNPRNHERMVNLRQMKIDRIADYLPHLDVEGDQDADTLLVGWGSTYGHIDAAMELLQSQGRKVAMAQFKYIRPLPANTEEVMRRFKKIIVIEQNLGQFASYLSGQINGLDIYKINKVEGQPMKVKMIAEQAAEIMDEK